MSRPCQSTEAGRIKHLTDGRRAAAGMEPTAGDPPRGTLVGNPEPRQYPRPTRQKNRWTESTDPLIAGAPGVLQSPNQPRSPLDGFPRRRYEPTPVSRREGLGFRTPDCGPGGRTFESCWGWAADRSPLLRRDPGARRWLSRVPQDATSRVGRYYTTH